MNEMFDLASGILQEGIRRGIKKARAEVREEVRAEVQEEVREETSRSDNLRFLRTLIDDFGCSLTEAVKFLKLPKEEEENLLEDLHAEEKQKSVGGVAGYVQTHKQETQQSMQDEKEVER